MIYYKLGNELFSKSVNRLFGENHFIPSIGLILVFPLKNGAINEYLKNNKVMTIIIV